MLNRAAEGVWTHTSECIQTNGVVVHGGEGALLIDPGLTTAELECLAADLRGLGLTAAAGFATHPDWDHALWHTGLGDVPRYATAEAVAYLDVFRQQPDWREQLVEGLPPEIADDVPLDLFGELTALPAASTVLPWTGRPLRLIEHAGHARGHAAVWVPDVGVLVAGDMLSDVLVPMPDLSGESADPLGDYLAALDLFDRLGDSVRVVIPGHGSSGDAAAFRSRLELDRAYVQALAGHGEVDDPRIGPAVADEWSWVRYIHEGHVARLSER